MYHHMVLAQKLTNHSHISWATLRRVPTYQEVLSTADIAGCIRELRWLNG